MVAKVKSAKKVAAHPPTLELVKEAVKAVGKPVKGASRQAISKFLVAKYGKALGSRFSTTLRLGLRRLTAKGLLVQTKGSFRLSPAAKKVKKAKKPKKKKAKKVKKAKKAKKAKKPKKAKKAKKVKKTKVKKTKKAKKPSKKVAKKASKGKRSTKKGAKKAAAAAPVVAV